MAEQPLKARDQTEARSSQARSTQATAPDAIERFVILRRLGCDPSRSRLGDGEAYAAEDPKLRRQVVVKMLKGRTFLDHRAAAFFQRVKALSELDHPSIAALHEVHPHKDGGWILVREYIDGDSLADLLESDDFGVELAAEVLAPVAEALDRAHLEGVAHGNLKTTNILIDNDGEPRLTDFRLAPDSQSAASKGTGGRCSVAGDIRSLGCILYEMLTGQPPQSQGEDEPIAQPTSLKNAVPISLEQICLRCLGHDAQKSFSSAGEFAKALRNWEFPLDEMAASGERTIAEGAPPEEPCQEPPLPKEVAGESEEAAEVETRSSTAVAVADRAVPTQSFEPTQSAEADEPVEETGSVEQTQPVAELAPNVESSSAFPRSQWWIWIAAAVAATVAAAIWALSQST